jgi:hypothetical protein
VTNEESLAEKESHDEHVVARRRPDMTTLFERLRL